MTLSDWQQRFLDANNCLPPDIDPAVRSARSPSARSPAATPRQGQASLSSERQRYLVQPGVKGHTDYTIWDTVANAPVATYTSRLDAINAAAQLNTSPSANP